MIRISLSKTVLYRLKCGCEQRRWTWDSKKYKQIQKAADVRRFQEENTRLFGPILKTSTIVPLGKQTKRRKPATIVLGKDLENWFDERYSLKLSDGKSPSQVNSGADIEQDGSGTSIVKDGPGTVIREDVKDIYVDFKHNNSNDPLSSKDQTDSKKDKDILNDILKCDLTCSDVGSSLEILKAKLDQCPLPTLPTVSGILARSRSPESQFFLDRWKAKMIGELGEEGFRLHQTETLQKGINLHTCIQQYLSGITDVPLQSNNQGHWDSIRSIIATIDEVQAIETRVTHPYLHYAGTFDCVATFKGSVCLIDWKTSQKEKPHLSSTFDYPLQVCAYMGAYNSNPANTEKLHSGLVVVAYPDGRPAHAHYMSLDQCNYYWKQWLERLHKFWTSTLLPST